MFNANQKKEALKIHEEVQKEYQEQYEHLEQLCEKLYDQRKDAVQTITMAEEVINSIAHKPKQFDTEFGKIDTHLKEFKTTEEYAQEAYKDSVKSVGGMATGTAVGIGMAAAAPTAMMGIATTFGTAATGTAISSLSGAAAQKAAIAWIGRTFVGGAVKSGAGMAAGQTLLALAGPLGWGITAVSVGTAIFSLNESNKKTAEKALENAEQMKKEKDNLEKIISRVELLQKKTECLNAEIRSQEKKILKYRNANYNMLLVHKRYFLGTLVNNLLSLSALLTATVEETTK